MQIAGSPKSNQIRAAGISVLSRFSSVVTNAIKRVRPCASAADSATAINPVGNIATLNTRTAIRTDVASLAQKPQSVIMTAEAADDMRTKQDAPLIKPTTVRPAPFVLS